MLRCLKAIVAGAMTFTAVPALAQSAWGFDEARVGRIYVEGMDQSCRVGQVGADLLVTSAHCVMAVGSESPVDPSLITFVPDRGAPEDDVLLISDIAVDPEFRREEIPSRNQVGRDVAYLRLSEALADPGDAMGPVDPEAGYLATLDITEEGTYIGVPCAADVEDDGVIILGCARDPGESGAPVYGMIDDIRVIVGVISADGHRGDAPVTFVASPYAALERVVWVGKERAIPDSY